MLGLFGRAASILSWIYRLAVLAPVGFALNAYGPTSGEGGSSYVEQLQQALSALKEIRHSLQ